MILSSLPADQGSSILALLLQKGFDTLHPISLLQYETIRQSTAVSTSSLSTLPQLPIWMQRASVLAVDMAAAAENYRCVMEFAKVKNGCISSSCFCLLVQQNLSITALLIAAGANIRQRNYKFVFLHLSVLFTFVEVKMRYILRF